MGGDSDNPSRHRGTSPVLRKVNRSLVLDVLRSDGPLARGALSTRTGLTRPAVSLIVAELLAEGLVVETRPPAPPGRRGRPPVLVSYNARRSAVLGVRIGRRGTRIVLGDGVGAELGRREVKELPRRPEDRLAAAVQAGRELLHQARVPVGRLSSVGVCLPGFIDAARGTCLRSPVLGWSEEVAVAQPFADVFRVPVFVRDETQAAAVAEAVEGAAVGADPVVVLDLGSRVAAAALVNGRLLRGATGLAGSVIGHTRMPGHEERCVCGRWGCLEALASTTAMLRAIDRRFEEKDDRGVRRRRRLRIREMRSALEAGDADVATVVVAGLEYGAFVAALMIDAFNPEVLVLTGSMAGEEQAAELVAKRALDLAVPEAAAAVDVRVSKLGIEAWVRGALLLALQESDQSYRLIFGSR